MATPADSDAVLGGAHAAPSAEDRLRALVSSAPVGIYEVTLDGREIYANERARRLAALSPGTLTPRAWLESLHPEDRGRVEAETAAAISEGREFELEYRFLHPDGTVVWVAGCGTAIRDAEGHATGFLGTITDITARKRAEAASREAEARFRRAFEDSASGMALIEGRGRDAGRFLEVNEALTHMSGYEAAELLRMSYWDLVHPDEVETMRRGVVELISGKSESFHAEIRMIGAGGVVKWIAFNVSLVRNAGGAPLSAVVHAQDVTERKRFETELQYLADHDPLTGLYNRRRFAVELEREIAAAERYSTGGAILVLDLDHFKLVNDSLGHSAGDELLAATARAIQGRLRSTDIVARLGGDEFGVILPHADQHRAILVAESLREVVRTVVGIEAGLAHVTASVGIVTFGEGELTRGGERMVTDADAAMYAAKQAGRDRVRVYSEGETRAALRLA
jgi:diguanylate cyclase (GGDEF)-like protein/PAS domain S-box-containing protein